MSRGLRTSAVQQQGFSQSTKCSSRPSISLASCLVARATQHIQMRQQKSKRKRSVPHLNSHDGAKRHSATARPPKVSTSSECGCGVDTEAGMLPGISRKRSIRSNPYWFTEFCNSQCLSHFAAPFIVVRAETSVAESCERKYKRK